MGCTLRIGLIGAGYLFLHACGLDGRIAAIVSGLVNRGFSNKKTNAARAKKRPTSRSRGLLRCSMRDGSGVRGVRQSQT
jgi:hypothetical protein